METYINEIPLSEGSSPVEIKIEIENVPERKTIVYELAKAIDDNCEKNKNDSE